MEPRPQLPPKPHPPLILAAREAVLAMAHFTQRQAPPLSPPHPSPVPMPTQAQRQVTSQRPRLLTNRVPTVMATGMKRRRCLLKARRRFQYREATTPCTALLTPAQLWGPKYIVIMVSTKATDSWLWIFSLWIPCRHPTLVTWSKLLIWSPSTGWSNQSNWSTQQGYGSYQTYTGQNQTSYPGNSGTNY